MWDKFKATSPQYVYHPDLSKTRLVVKPEHLPVAEAHFQDTGIQVTTQEQRHLGDAIGSRNNWRTLFKGKSLFGYLRLRSYPGLPKSNLRQHMYSSHMD